MTPDATTIALLKAIEAAPADRVVRFALSDHLRESGHEAWADAVLATAAYAPWRSETSDGGEWSWWSAEHYECEGGGSEVPYDLRSRLQDYCPRRGDAGGQRVYLTFAAALLDLWRAWVAANKEGVTA